MEDDCFPQLQEKRTQARKLQVWEGGQIKNSNCNCQKTEDIATLQREEIDKNYRLTVTEDELNKERNVINWLQTASRIYIYVDVLWAPNRCAWKGTCGAIHPIWSALFLSEGTRNVASHVLDQAHTLVAMGTIHNGERQRPQSSPSFYLFSKLLLAPASEDLQMLQMLWKVVLGCASQICSSMSIL